MKKLLNFFITYNVKYWLKEKRKSIINIIGIGISIAVTLTVLLIGVGNENANKDGAISTNGGQISIGSFKTELTSNQGRYLEDLKKDSKIDYSTTYLCSTKANYQDRSTMIILRFVDPTTFPLVGSRYLNQSLVRSLKPDEVVLTSDIAKRLQVETGKKINVYNEQNSENLHLTVKAITEKGEIGTYDNPVESDLGVYGFALTPSTNLSKYKAADNSFATRIFINKRGNTSLKHLRKEFANAEITTSNEMYEKNTASAQNSNKVLSIIGLISFLVSGISLSATLLMAVKDRTKEFAVLKSLGMNNKRFRNVIILEALSLCLISSLVGMPLGIITSLILSKSVLKIPLIYMLSRGTFLAIIKVFALSMIFGLIASIIPISFGTKINVNAVLRSCATAKIKYTKQVIFILISLSVVFSIFMNSLLGVLVTALMTLICLLLYLLARIFIALISRIKIKNKFVQLVFSDFRTYRKNFSLIIIILITAILCMGITINLASSIKSSLLSTSENQLNYNTIISTKLKDKQQVEKILDNTRGIESHYSSLKLESSLNQIDEKPVKEFVHGDIDESIKSRLNSLTIEGVNLNDDIGMTIAEGRRLSRKDRNGNAAIITQDMADVLNIKTGDKLSLIIAGKALEFKIVGIKASTLINTSDIIVSYQSLNKLDKWNSSILYVKVDEASYSNTIKKLYKNINNSFILSLSDVLSSLLGTMKKQIIIFTCISVFVVLSALFLIINITLMLFKQRENDFITLRIVGATNKNLSSLTTSENMIIGLFSGILSVILINGLSTLILGLLTVDYSMNIFANVVIVCVSILITQLTSWIVTPKIESKEINVFLRNQQ